MGQRLLNYEVLERLGEGARSTIYLVVDPETGRKYALKHVKRDDQKDIRFIEQMEHFGKWSSTHAEAEAKFGDRISALARRVAAQQPVAEPAAAG